MTQELLERSRERHALAGLPVILTTLSLVVSLMIAATAVLFGIARADSLMSSAKRGGLTAVVVTGDGRPQRLI
ncbi:hypothetical protein [Rhodoplanes sp. Z2-YC6860]|uniref:hypothetical protein n=1 Tax=Rhodoplanes sp. Z2-YC6860 TaxID=674703 RepID=UPI000A52EE09|nr:hypothetical protein [Rhodoplanes sp. Z2-YC6860]